MSPKREGREQDEDADKGSTGAGSFVVTGSSGRSHLLSRLRAYFLTGVIVTAPIGITALLVWQFITYLDSQVGSLLPAQYNPQTYLPFGVPGLGLLIVLVFLTLVGFLAAGLAGRTLVRIGESILSRMPVVRSVYGTLKQIFETVLAQSSRSFREVVLVEYPRRGLGAIGFVTGPTEGEIQARSDEELVNVFLPTTPNPTSGFLLFVPRKDLIHLDMSIEDAIKLVISGGIVGPKSQSQLDILADAATQRRKLEEPPAVAGAPRPADGAQDAELEETPPARVAAR